MFLNQSQHMTAADIFCFCRVLQSFSELSPYQKSQYLNVYRWALQIQAMEGISEIVSDLGFTVVEEIPFGIRPSKPKGGQGGNKKNKKNKNKNNNKPKKKRNRNKNKNKNKQNNEKPKEGEAKVAEAKEVKPAEAKEAKEAKPAEANEVKATEC